MVIQETYKPANFLASMPGCGIDVSIKKHRHRHGEQANPTHGGQREPKGPKPKFRTRRPATANPVAREKAPERLARHHEPLAIHPRRGSALRARCCIAHVGATFRTEHKDTPPGRITTRNGVHSNRIILGFIGQRHAGACQTVQLAGVSSTCTTRSTSYGKITASHHGSDD